MSKNGKTIPVAPSSMLLKIPMVNNTQKDVMFFVFHLAGSSSNASFIIQMPTPQNIIKIIQALNSIRKSKIVMPINQPNKGKIAVERENAIAILIVKINRFLEVVFGNSKHNANARAKSSRDNPNAKRNNDK